MMIARPDGAIDWLYQIGDEDYGYADFVAGLDGVLMGRKTYDILLSLGPWPYGDLTSVVLSRAGIADPQPGVKVMKGSIGEAMQPFAPDARIWLVGGGEIVAQAITE